MLATNVTDIISERPCQYWCVPWCRCLPAPQWWRHRRSCWWRGGEDRQPGGLGPGRPPCPRRGCQSGEDGGRENCPPRPGWLDTAGHWGSAAPDTCRGNTLRVWQKLEFLPEKETLPLRGGLKYIKFKWIYLHFWTFQAIWKLKKQHWMENFIPF